MLIRGNAWPSYLRLNDPCNTIIQIVTITADCFNSANDLLHLFVHLLGLDHEHNMYDRDEYLTIVWDELPPGKVMLLNG